MERRRLTIVKVGGAIVEDGAALERLVGDFGAIEGPKALVHGGGRRATAMAARLGIESRMVGGRRVTDAAMLEVVTMVYGGLVNKDIVARLQARGIDALGLTGADMGVILSRRRPVADVDYGFVGDVVRVDAAKLDMLLSAGVTPVLAPLTHDLRGNILNTNADTIASETAKALSALYDVTLVFCLEKGGVLMDPDDGDSVIPVITPGDFPGLVSRGIVSGGMIPKLENAIAAVAAGVSRVSITIATAIDGNHGTLVVPDGVPPTVNLT